MASKLNKRRPTSTRYCKSSVGSSAMVMDATVRFSYHMETNKAVVKEEERDLALSLLRDDMLQSLVNVHCPKKERAMPVAGASASTSASASASTSAGGKAAEGGKQRRHLELEVLSLHSSAAQLSTLGEHSTNQQCLLTTPASKSCATYSNDLMLLLDSIGITNESSPDQLKVEVSSTIQDYMDHNFYTDLVNHKLSEQGSDLVVTAFSFVGDAPNAELKEVEMPTTTATSEGTNAPSAIVRDSVNAPASLVTEPTSQQDINSNSQVTTSEHTITIVMGTVVGLFALIVGLLLWKRCRASSKHSPTTAEKGDTVKDHDPADDTLVTGDESLTYGIEEGTEYFEDEDTLGSLATRSFEVGSFATKSCIGTSSGFGEDESTTFLSRNTMESSNIMNSLPPSALCGVAAANRYCSLEMMGGGGGGTATGGGRGGGEDPPGSCATGDDGAPCMGSDATSYNTGRCASTGCRACTTVTVRDDPQYLCPNYQLPGTPSCGDINDGSRDDPQMNFMTDVSIRVFEEESNYHETVDSVVPPSQVSQSRGRHHQAILFAPDTSFGFNSLLASGSEDISNDGTAGKSQGSTASPFYIQRTLRPAKTIAL